jgi:hypothetical protein
VNDLVYLYLPVIKPVLTKKFARKWAGTFKVAKKISDLNYEIISQKDKKQVVHINRLKKAYNQNLWKPKQEQETVKKPPKQSAKRSDQSEYDELSFHPFPLKLTDDPSVRTEVENVPDQTLDNPDSVPLTLDTPHSERTDPSYSPPGTPRSRRELQPTRSHPPVTRSRARIMSQDSVDTASNSDV